MVLNYSFATFPEKIEVGFLANSFEEQLFWMGEIKPKMGHVLGLGRQVVKGEFHPVSIELQS